MKEANDIISGFSRKELHELQEGKSLEVVSQAITIDDVLVSRTARSDVVIETLDHLTVALETRLDDRLIDEGLVRETVSQLQKLRKDLGLDVTDRIQLQLASASSTLANALQRHEDYIKQEVLAVLYGVNDTNLPELAGVDAKMLEIDDHQLTVRMAKA